jgi:hypothetical protein
MPPARGASVDNAYERVAGRLATPREARPLLASLRRAFAGSFSEGGVATGALVLALLYAAIPPIKGLIEAFSSPFVFQDDARQFVFWMHRWMDPALFAGDLNAEYWQSVTPLGYQALFRAAAAVGIDPVLLDKLLPPVLGLALAYYAFRLTLRITPVPAAAFLASALTVFFMWLMEDTASGTPRAFAVPMFLAFLVYLVEKRTLAVIVVALLQGLLYPQMSLIYPGVLALSLLRWEDARPALSRARGDWLRAMAGCVAVLVSLLPFLLDSGAFGPAITLAEVQSSPAFQPGGRSEFFLPDPVDFYLCGIRSGLLPVQWGCYSAYDIGLSFAPAIAIGELLFALGLPLLVALSARRAGPGHPRPAAWLLVAAVASGTALFLAAHILLFRMHLPARYGQHTLRAVSMVVLAVALAPALLRAARWGSAPARLRAARRTIAGIAAFTIAGGLFGLTIGLPVIPRMEYVHPGHPALYAYIAAQPKDAVIASLAAEADNLPILTGRTVLATREYAIPYSTGYIGQLRERTAGLIEAAYSDDPAAVRNYLDRVGASLLLLDAEALAPAHVAGAWWRHDYPGPAAAALAAVESRRHLPLARLIEACGERPDPAFVILAADCIARSGE